MTCHQLGGACDKELHANTFEEISEIGKQHGMEMFNENNVAHLNAMNKMRELIKTADSHVMKNWMKMKREEFNTLTDNE